jgi:hypothetical protein
VKQSPNSPEALRVWTHCARLGLVPGLPMTQFKLEGRSRQGHNETNTRGIKSKPKALRHPRFWRRAFLCTCKHLAPDDSCSNGRRYRTTPLFALPSNFHLPGPTIIYGPWQRWRVSRLSLTISVSLESNGPWLRDTLDHGRFLNG